MRSLALDLVGRSCRRLLGVGHWGRRGRMKVVLLDFEVFVIFLVSATVVVLAPSCLATCFRTCP